MSHASIVVAIDVVDPQDRAEIEAAVQWQMEPFQEADEWFGDGTRWDWYQIGGRFTGKFTGYKPHEDPANTGVCEMCLGTGTRPNGRSEFGEAWFVGNNGCNGCHGKGRRLNWGFVPHEGDVLQVKNLAREVKAFAFLRERHWNEGERLGWFGEPARTECEIKAVADADVLTRRCLTKGKENAQIVVWNEPEEIWEAQYHKRFIERLSPETVLVLVDYHV